MATDADIEEAVDGIQEQWTNPISRNAVFGNIIKSLGISNVRGQNCSIEFQWPVCAIAGVNGTGKTTILQLCSTAYAPDGKRLFRLGNWIRNAMEGETPPVKDPAKLIFNFWNDTPTLTIPYIPAQTRWGYPRRNNPARHVEFIGISEFAPRIEQRDRAHVFRKQLRVKATRDIDAREVESISRILGSPYSGGRVNTVSTSKGEWEFDLPQLQRGGYVYSEPHMGAGEQKVVRLVARLEALPRNSLVLLEEPETTLHPDAQRGLAWYLMALAKRRGHQILIATHSTEIFQALPSEGRILLVRDGAGIRALPRAPYFRAARELAASMRSNKDLLLVEDEVARQFLLEILRRNNRALLTNSEVVPLGSADDVRRNVEALREQRVRAVGVRDADVGEQFEKGLLSLPGDMAPEVLLLDPANIARASGHIADLQMAFERAEVRGQGLQGTKKAKKVFNALCDEVGMPAALLSDRLTLAWLEENAEGAAALAERIEQCLDAVHNRGPAMLR
ncbi:MAG: ATP-dependent nuclease [Myxococcaceae bacterium]